MKKEIAKWISWGAVIGIIVILIIGFGFGGWVLDSTAQKRAEQMVEKAVIDSLTPICVAQFQQDPNKEEKLNELKKINAWSRDEYVKEQGWATMPGQKESYRDVAGECARKIIELE